MRQDAIRTIDSREVYRNKWMRVREDAIERPDGERGIYGVVDKDPACIVIALEDGAEGERVHLVSQFRYTSGARYMELPQGGWERAEVDPEEMARGELREETGLSAGRMTLLGTLRIGYGVLNQIQYVYLAEELTAGEAEREAEECDLETHCVPVAEFEEKMLDGTIVDNCTLAAWGLYRMWRERNPR